MLEPLSGASLEPPAVLNVACPVWPSNVHPCPVPSSPVQGSPLVLALLRGPLVCTRQPGVSSLHVVAVECNPLV